MTLLLLLTFLGCSLGSMVDHHSFRAEPPACNGNNRTDCGYNGINQDQCESKGCCWVPVQELDAPEDTPWCFFTSYSPGCDTTPICSGHGTCNQGLCQCDAGYSTCSANYTAADCSVNTATDMKNCGGCDNACPTGTGIINSVCNQGICNVTCDSDYVFCYGSCVKATSCDSAPPYSDGEIQEILNYFAANIDPLGNGAVLASPSQSHPDYYYHWMRDAAISMNVLLDYNTNGQFDTKIKDYVTWVRKVQFISDPNGIDVRGEPKFFVNGTVYNGGWLRPQNDGAGLRAIALTNYANILIAQGQSAYVNQYLYSSDPNQPGIKRDLDYVASIWESPTGDPWEEVTGQHFFTWMCQRKGLLIGAKLASSLGDTTSANNYNTVAKNMESNINSHWNAATGVIMETPPGHGGPQKFDELDSAVHLGVLYGANGDGFYEATDSKVLSSVTQLLNWFTQPSVFPINKLDDTADIPGLLVGRYPNDTYDGYGGGVGNPWILCTNALGELYYRNALLSSHAGEVKIDEYNSQFYKRVAQYVHNERLESLMIPGHIISLKDEDGGEAFRSLMSALVSQADGFLIRVKYHTSSYGLHFSEQINLNTGAEQGANDLTWSYGTLLGAMLVRPQAIAAIKALQGYPL